MITILTIFICLILISYIGKKIIKFIQTNFNNNPIIILAEEKDKSILESIINLKNAQAEIERQSRIKNAIKNELNID